MKQLLKKEFRLAASPLSFFFIAFGCMAMLPGYPIVLGGFFVCLGLFQSFQSAREAGDILYTAMLPVSKVTVVSAKFLFSVTIELIAFSLMAVLTGLRMAFLSDAQVYLQNSLLNANLAFLGWVLMLFAVFNGLFIGGFFRTAYKIGIPFLSFGIVAAVVVTLSEALGFFPGMAGLKSTGFAPVQLVILAIGIGLYLAITAVSYFRSVANFERIDL